MADRKKTSSTAGVATAGGGRKNPTATAVPPTRIKVISMGAGASGKSCLIKRFCEERFVSKYIATIGVGASILKIILHHNLIFNIDRLRCKASTN